MRIGDSAGRTSLVQLKTAVRPFNRQLTTNLLPGNVDEHGFAEQDLAAAIDCGDNSTPYWTLSLAEALVEALSYVVARIVAR